MKLTDKEILKYNNLITEFRGYVYVGKPFSTVVVV